MLPHFDIDGGLLLASVRGVSVAALLSIFGTLVFRVAILPRCFDRMTVPTAARVQHRLVVMTQGSVVAGVLGLLGWLVVQAADMANARSLDEAVRATPLVLSGTVFGHLIAAQMLALLAVAGATGQRDRPWRQAVALGFATLALGVQGGHSHAASMSSGVSLLLASDVVHLMSAGAWLGGLLPLLVVVQACPAKAAAAAARWFSPMGKLCLVALTATAMVQGWVLIEGVPGLVGTAYGWMALVKLGLFGVLFGFAALNRYRLAPALLQGDPAAAKRVLIRSLAVQTGFGLAIVAAASVLSSLAPAMDQQPVWPFADRFTLATIGEDPDFRNEVLGAALALAGSALLLGAAILVRHRLRWVGACGAAVIAWFAIPHLDLLFVPAYPTSFYTSPTHFAATSIMEGASLFPQTCAMCHGTEGRGNGPAAAGLPVPPADLTAAHLWMHSDGELFWWLTHGIEAPEGGLAMPGFGTVLSADQRWALIDFIHARNAGLTFHGTGSWSPAIQAPALQARCEAGRMVSLADLRGGFVRVVIGAATPAAMPGVTTILVASAAQPSPGVCIADDETLPPAFAILAGVPNAGMAGTQFLIDGAGWLRAATSLSPGWNDPHTLQAELRELTAHPIAAGTGHGDMDMRM